MGMNPYRSGGMSVGAQSNIPTPSDSRFPVNIAGVQAPEAGCGLPAPIAAGPPECADMPGTKYCRSSLGGSILVPAGGTATITLSPTNATIFVARMFHITATSVNTSPVAFTQAFAITAVRILGDNQFASDQPVIGSMFSAEQTLLEVFWDRAITAVNPAFIDIQNLDPALDIQVFAVCRGDMVKS